MGIRIKQHDITDCGAACLASVASHFKLNLPIARIRQMASTDQKGTNLLGMMQAAEKLGFITKGVRGNREALQEIPTPTIAHVIVRKQLHHFVVIYKVTATHVTVMDPGTGKMSKRKLDDFMEEWSGVLLLIAPGETFETGDRRTSVGRRFWHLMFPHRATLIQALFGAVIYTVLGLATSIYIQKITDHVLINGNTNLLNLLSMGMVVILVLAIFIGAVKSILVLRSGQLIDARLILGYYKHLLHLPQRFFDTMRVGEIISRIGDAVKIRAFINDVAINLLVNVFIIVFSFALMFTYYWKLALILTTILPLYVLLYYISNKLNKRRERELMERSADLETQLVESLNSVRTIKQLGLEDFSNLKTESRFVALLQTTYKSGLNSIFSGQSSELVSRAFTIILLWVGSYFVIDRSITPGELLSFYALIGYFTGPARGLIGMNKTIQNALIAADRLFEIIDLEQEVEEHTIELTAERIGDIRLKQVRFAYGSRAEVFEELSLVFPAGQVTGIVGESGSGKSTVAALLQKLYRIQDGRITIGDYDLQYISTRSLRQRIGVVPQQLDLFAGTVLENITLGDGTPNLQQVIEVCKQLGLLAFIESLPQGFNTYIGEHGVNLSGGQRQRMAIARALYRQPNILILDEATASLDSVSEQYVQQTLAALQRRGMTTIIIAHRLSTIMDAQKIVVLEEGRLIEEGNHEELLALQGQYYALWSKQFPENVRLHLAA